MKYKISRVKQEGNFKPFSIKLTVETKEEYENFHNNVMGKLTLTVIHEFHGVIYNVGQGNIDEAEGKI